MLVILQLSDYDEQQTIKVTLSLFSQTEDAIKIFKKN